MPVLDRETKKSRVLRKGAICGTQRNQLVAVVVRRQGFSERDAAAGERKPQSQIRQALVHRPRLLPSAQILLPDVRDPPRLARLRALSRPLRKLLCETFRAPSRRFLPEPSFLRPARAERS